MALHNDLGTRGERITGNYLQGKGYQILERNWRCRRAEIDLIAMDGDILVFIEVKTRSGIGFGEPELFVGREKQRMIAFAAEQYIHLKRHQMEVRFDIISILFNTFGNYQINHIKDAFWP